MIQVRVAQQSAVSVRIAGAASVRVESARYRSMRYPTIQAATH